MWFITLLMPITSICSSRIKVVKAIDMKRENRLSTGCEKLDNLLQGGLPNRGIVEIAGESGCGKSQLCMQLTLTVQYPRTQGGFESGAVYICTEERFQSRRLYQLIQNFPNAYYRHNNNKIAFGDNILIVHVNTFDSLELCLRKIQGPIFKRKLKLLIIDSIAAVFRGYYAAYESRKRVRHLRAIGSLLHRISTNHNMLIVCVNQVAYSFKERRTVPALGLAWANFVTTRLFLTRHGSYRFMKVLFSPDLPTKLTADYTIQASGVQ